jgi:hypothetical protein
LQAIGVTFKSPALAVPALCDPSKLAVLALLTAFMWLLPNSMQLLAHVRPVLEAVRPPRLWWPLRAVGETIGVMHADGTLALGMATGVAVGTLVLSGLVYQVITATRLQQFIYFQF